MSGYTTDSLTVNHSGQRVWGVARSLHAKDLFCRFRNRVSALQPLQKTKCLVPTHLYTNCLVPTQLYANCIVPTQLYTNCLVTTQLYTNCLVPTQLYTNCLVTTQLYANCLVPTQLYTNCLVPTQLYANCLVPTQLSILLNDSQKSLTRLFPHFNIVFIYY